MSRSGRKRNSKWDLKEVPELPLHDDDWRRKSNLSYRDKDSHPGRHDSELTDLKDRKWGARKNDHINEDCIMAWDGEENYSMKMSPGLDEWRRKRSTLSPNRGLSRSRRSRSRSRSPGRGFKCDLGASDRSRNRTGVNQICRDFASGRCRGGDRCEFVHHYQNYEDKRHSEGGLLDSRDNRPTRSGASKYSDIHDNREYTVKNGKSIDYCNNYLKGKCWKGEACKYTHHNASDGSEVFREGLADRRNSDRSSDREPRRSGPIPCKFYSAGNCRNGKYCRFSHHGQTYLNADGRSREDRRRVDPNVDNAEQLTGGLVWGDSNASLDSTNFGEVKNGQVGGLAIESIQSMDDNLKAEDNRKSELVQCKTEDTSPELGVSKSMDTEMWRGDVDKPAYFTQISHPNFNNTYVPAHEQDLTSVASSQMCHTSTSDHAVIYEKSSFQNNPNGEENAPSIRSGSRNPVGDGTGLCVDLNFSANALPYKSFNYNDNNITTQPLTTSDVIGQGQVALLPINGGNPGNSQNCPQFLEEKSKKPDNADANTSQVTPGIVPAQNTVNSEQLAQLTNLSASLAQLLGSGQQLPQLYAALNCTSAMEPLSVPPNALGLGAQVSGTSIQGISATGSRKQYEPLSAIESLPPPPNYASLIPQVNATPNQTNPAVGSQKPYDLLSVTEPLPLPPPPDHVGLVMQAAATSDLTNLAVGSRKQYDPLSTTELPVPSISVGLVTQVAATSFQINPAIESQKYDPLSDSINPIDPGKLNGGSSSEAGKLEDVNQMKSAVDYEVSISNGVGAKESKIAEEEVPETGILSKLDGNGKIDVNKKNKDAKVIRAFKFALAEFVKELLKPTWKDGRINKDIYKIIVKKVVDKVTSTIEGVHIPQNQEKINHYLSSSKPKLTKLVQAYVERHQKS